MDKRKENRKVFSLLIIGIASAMTVFASTASWFVNGSVVDMGNSAGGDAKLQAGAETFYYAGGTGTSNDPYIISDRVHLYNLAWLQYIGYYNTPSIQQKYFKIVLPDGVETLDMSGLTLPPIGTDTYPFLGHFDGNGNTISNLIISNDDPTQPNSAFGSAKPSPTSIPSEALPPEIVGFFGVVGQLPDQDLTYSTSIVSVSNVVLKNLTVSSLSQKTLIGLAAGYIDGSMSGVRVSGASTIDLGSSSKQIVSSDITSNVSDYGLVGYSTQSKESVYKQVLSKYYSSDDPSHGGSDSWGGSMPMRAFNMFIYNHFLDDENANHLRASHISKTASTLNSYTSPTNDYKINMYYSCYSTGNVVTTINSSGTAYSTYMAPDAFNSIGTSSGKSALMYKLATGSYIPLQFNENEDEWEHVKASNAGYIAGKNNSVVMGSVYQKKMGNSTGDSAVGYSAAGGIYDTLYSDSTPLEVVTYSSSGSTAGWCLIKDDKNKNHTVANTRITEYKNKKYEASTLGYQGYANARSKFETNLLKDQRLNGIQFINSVADGNLPSMLTISSGLKVAGKTNADYTNYQVPEGYINFNANSSGHISLFAGTYNAGTQPTTMTFFSLYKVDRNPTTGVINSMTRISEVYENTASGTTNPYVFKYSSGSYSSGSHGSSPVMNLTNSLESELPMNSGSTSSKNNLIYYFEIPINEGEYAIGMVPGKASGVSGANLVYLDIGTNGDDSNDKAVCGYNITTEIGGLKYPEGVDFEVVGTTGTTGIANGGVSFCVQYAANASGSTTFTVTSTNVAISSQSTVIPSKYSYQGINYSTESGPPTGTFNVTNGPNSIISLTTSIVKVSHIKIGTYSEILVTDILSGTNSGKTTYRYNSTDYVSNDNNNGPVIPSAISGAISQFTASEVTNIRGLEEAITISRSLNGAPKEFNCVLPDLPWGTTSAPFDNNYSAEISSYPSGLILNVSRTNSIYGLKINTASVSFDSNNKGTYSPS